MVKRAVLSSLMLLGLASTSVPIAAAPAHNIAPLAKVSASVNTENASHAVDGGVPAAGSRDDAGQTWVIKTADLPASLTFTWDKPQPIRTVAYYGRTTWGFECFKDYEVYLDDTTTPAAKGAFRQGHGPQLIELPEGSRAAKLTLKILSANGGNPGASEVQVFTAPPEPKDLLCRFTDLSLDYRYAYYPSHNLVRIHLPSRPPTPPPGI